MRTILLITKDEYTYNITLLKQITNFTQYAMIIINGYHSRERLGKSIKFAVNNASLLIGAPHYSSALTFEKGIVYLFTNISSLPSSILSSKMQLNITLVQ